MIKVGDKIKVIPDSYISLLKLDFHQPSAWNDVSAGEGALISLGGTYEVLAIKRSVAPFAGNKEINFYKIIQGNTNFDRISEFDVQLLEKVPPCPFEIGDTVVFRPKCSEQELRSISTTINHFGLNDPDKEHVVIEVLNEYYIFVDATKDYPYSFPFRWIDFELKA